MIETKTIQKRKPSYFWTEEIITTELTSIIENTGSFPTQEELKVMGKGDLLSAIRRDKGFNYFREKMGHEHSRKPRGYWNDENILFELKVIISDIGHFPSHMEMKNANRSDLSNAISNHKGVNYYREKLGLETIVAKKVSWSESKIIMELESISLKLGHFPTRKELVGMKRSDLASAICRHASFLKYQILLNHKIYVSKALKCPGK